MHAPPPNDSRLTLTLLGEASLRASTPGHDADRVLGPGKPLALLAFLRLSPGHQASRDYLLDLLWANQQPKEARHALRQAVWYLRNRLGDDILQTGERQVSLGVTIGCDVTDFLDALEAGRPEEAVAHYAGEFLPDLALPGGAEFEHWADGERERLRSLFFRSAEQVVRRQLTAGRFKDAESLARQVRDGDPLNEMGWRLLLEALSSAGDVVRSAVEADQLERLLADEGRTPEAATRSVIELAKVATPTPGEAPGDGGLVVELVGREQEFSAVLRAWEEAQSGAGRQVHLSGRAGLGKSRLLHDVAARLRATGATVVHLAANQGELDLPYSLAGDIAAALADVPGARGVAPASAAALVSINPALSAVFDARLDRSQGSEALRRRTMALTDLASAVADEKPVALLIDDLHWADESSSQVLRGLLQRMTGCAILIVTAARPAADNNWDATAADSLVLRPLSTEQIAALLASISALPAEEWAEELPARLMESTGGSPLLVLETISLALEKSWLSYDQERWRCHEESALRQALTAGGALKLRIGSLPAGEKQLLRLLSLAGVPLGVSDIDAMMSDAEGHTRDQLACLEKKGLAGCTPAGWVPAHDEIGDSAIEDLADSDSVALHTRIGMALAASASSDPSLLRAARHLTMAQAWGSLALPFRRWIGARRRQGDRRPLRVLVAEFLGPHATRETAANLVAGLPLRVRLAGSRAVQAIALVALIAAGGWAIGSRASNPDRPPPDAVLYAVTFGAAGPETQRFDLRRSDWDEALRPAPGSSSTLPPRVAMAWLARQQAYPSPDGETWVIGVESPDSGGADLHLVVGDSVDRRLTFSPATDAGAQWAPDASRLVFATSRWRSTPGYDLATIDISTGAIVPLNAGAPPRWNPVWSPDGTRISYQEGLLRPLRFCWTTVDGTSRSCFLSPDSTDLVGSLGWRDATHVLAEFRSLEGAFMALVDVDDWSVDSVGPLPPYLNRIVDARTGWMARLVAREGLAGPVWSVGQPAAPGGFRRLPVSDGSRRTVVFWGPGPILPFLDRITIRTPENPLPAGVPLHLSLLGFDQDGEPTPVVVSSWSTDDTTVATIDDDGILLPRNPGTVTVRASAGGWRTDSVTVRIGEPTFTMVLQEEWHDGALAGWQPFGDPRPVVVARGERQTLWARGDGNFHSGVYSRAGYDVGGSFGFEALVSVPSMADAWQDVRLSLIAIRSPDPTQWDGVFGNAPWEGQPERIACRMEYPSGVGQQRRRFMGVSAGSVSNAETPVDERLASGEWFRFRLQVFPDGTCGIAVDGEPVWRSTTPRRLTERHHVVLEGSSVDTEVLIGKVEGWYGVRDDVDWGELD